MKRTLYVLLALLIVAPLAAANPSLTVTPSSTDPTPITAGDTATIYVKLQNTGTTPAEDATITYDGHRYFELLQPSDEEKTVRLLGAKEDLTLAYEVSVQEEAAAATYNLPFTITAANDDATLKQDVEITVEPDRPTLHIETVTTTPSPLQPGQQGSVTMTVANEGHRALQNIDVTMDVENTPFLAVGQTNTERVSSIERGGEREITFPVATNPGTSSDLYSLPFTLTFDDTTGSTTEKTVQTGVRIGAEPELAATLSETDITQETMQGDVSLNIVNNGLADVKLLKADLKPHPSYETTSASSYYIGDIESDDFDVISFTAEAQNASLTVPVELTYRTAFNEERTTERVVSYTLPQGSTSTSYTLYIIVVLVVAVGIWWYRRR
jgi:hypothetical protein